MALTEAQKRQAERTRKYWADREAEALKQRIKDEKQYDKQINRIYSDMLDGVQREINAFYGKYADKEGISIAEAKKRVSALDIAEYERKAKRYVRDASLDRKVNGGKTNKKGYYFSPQAEEEMRLYNLTMKVNRLEMLKANIGLELIQGHQELENFMADILKERTEDELKRQAGILGKTVKNNAEKANSIVNASFHNAKFSDRVWQYQDMMKADLSKLLQSGLIQGKNPRTLARELKKQFNASTYHAERLMRTELARVQTDAQKQSFIRNGFEEYEFIVNTGCCDICAGLNGKHFKVSKMMPGENAPPMHPHCRCSVAAYEDSEEYNAWLNYLEKGGTTAEWNKLKYKEGLTKSVNKRIIKSEKFNTTEDPMREVTGVGVESHPEEIKRIKQALKDAGVELEYRTGTMAYSPAIIAGKPGKIIIDEEASYSAWVHEYTHFLDDKKDGFLGMRVFADVKKCIQREIHAYDEEIKLAKQANRPDIVERLEKLKRKEVARYENPTD